MAKKTKDSNLSVEERLEQALIPNWDEPYKLPENWCWVYLTKGFAQCLDSFRKPVNASDRSEMQGDIPYYGATGQVGWINDYLTNEHLVLLGEDGAPFLDYEKNKAYIIKGKAWVNNHAHILKSFYGEDSNLYLMHYLNVFNYHGYVNGSTRLKLTQESMNSIPVPLAPIDEQQRIVSRIESLFAKLDEAKEKAQEVVVGFETRKAAILHKAFSGELTAKWREENDVDISNYVKRRFDEVAIIKSNLVDPAEYQNYPHIAPDNIEKKTGVLLEYHTIAEDGVKSGKHRFYPGQILYSKIRPNLSKVVVVDFDGLCSADMYPIEALGDARCLWYFMLSENFLEQASSAGSRSVLPKINQKELSVLTVTIPDSIEEQKEIANIIDSLFAKEYQVKETAEAVIEQIDIMKKAILARAFRGELGTNDPREESAVELLKKVLDGDADVQALAKKPTKRSSIPSDIKIQD